MKRNHAKADLTKSNPNGFSEVFDYWKSAHKTSNHKKTCIKKRQKYCQNVKAYFDKGISFTTK